VHQPSQSAAKSGSFATVLSGASKWILALAMTAIVALMLMFLAGVFHHKVPADSAKVVTRSAEGLRTVSVRLLKRTRYETAVGTVKPVHESSVASKLLAKVIETSVTAGQMVTEGQILVQLDDSDLQARLKQSEAALTSAEVHRDQATTELARAQKLQEKNAISKAEFDRAESTMKSAESAVNQAKHAVHETQIMLDHATIRSPMNGTVIDKRVEAGDTVSPGQVLLTLFDPSHMQMVASVRESLAMHLKPGQVLPTRLDALDLDCEATISELVPEADVASRSFTVKVTGPCPPGAYSGMFGRLQLPLEDEEVLVIPMSAIRRVGQLTMVEVVHENTVQVRNVRIGRSLEADVEVLAGLSAGELVVVK
jgi:RND family efflux transporter MFP subunit